MELTTTPNVVMEPNPNLYLKLCYIKDNWAYFTSQDVRDQGGDDWDDAPFEHNAGEPYEPDETYEERGFSWEIQKIAWDGYFVTPNHGHLNSPYCVNDINKGEIAWLRKGNVELLPEIKAGASLLEFEIFIQKNGGMTYSPMPLYQGGKPE